MGVLFHPSNRTRIDAERTALMRNLAEASDLGRQLDEITREIQRGTESLHYLIDPENN